MLTTSEISLKSALKSQGRNLKNLHLEEEILPLIRDFGHTGDIKVLSDVNINHMHQPWRSLAAIINKCLSGKTTGLERLCLLRAQLLWGHSHCRLTSWQRIINIKENTRCYATRPGDGSMVTTIRVILQTSSTQIYSVILPSALNKTKPGIGVLEAYMTYHVYVTGEKTLKPKKKKADSESSPKEKPAQASKGKRLKTPLKVAQSTKKKQPATKSKAKGLIVLSEVALTEAEQMKLATKRSLIQTHSSHASGSGDEVDTLSKVLDEKLQKKTGIDEGAGDKPEVPNVPEYNSDSEEESWTFSQGDDDDDANEESDAHNDSDENESDDEGDDFVHPNLSTYTADDQDKEENQVEEKVEDDEDLSDQRVYTPPDY
ncbi:hypothetical protein Tco_1297148 [Tanacetum coccineum]